VRDNVGTFQRLRGDFGRGAGICDVTGGLTLAAEIVVCVDAPAVVNGFRLRDVEGGVIGRVVRACDVTGVETIDADVSGAQNVG
jgi:hypothetical protein